MTKEEVAQAVHAAFQKHRRPGSAAVSVDGTQDLFATGHLDSFALWEMIAELETATGVKIPEGDSTPANFNMLVKFIERFSPEGA